MDTLTKSSKCPACKKPMKVREQPLFAIEAQVVGCSDCGRFGIVGDDAILVRDPSGREDEELEQNLVKRAHRVIDLENKKQVRYQDVETGRVWGSSK
jgi:uncharacterized protein YbaR (Trm112 family)